MDNKKDFGKQQQQQGKIGQGQDQNRQTPKNLEPQGDQKGAQQISESERDNVKR